MSRKGVCNQGRTGPVVLDPDRSGTDGPDSLAFAGSGPESRGVEGREGFTGDSPAGEGGRGLRLVLLVALLAGVAARIAVAFFRPLWADEVFTLALARRPLADLLPALRLDSGPPLHYLAARLVLLPFASPGPGDVLVRLLSVTASLLHVPLLLSIGRRCRAPRAGVVAASLFLVFPLAVASGAEGRGYALASLLVLAAFERLLALEASPRVRTAVVAGLLGGTAVLTHYLALLPVAGILLARLAAGGARRLAVLSAAIAAAVTAAWLPVALGQPRASMAWTEVQPLGERALQLAANLGLGLSVPPEAARFLGPIALAFLAVALADRRARARIPVAGPLLAGLVLLGPLLLFSRSAVLPDRTALVFLPFVALVLAEARAVVPAAAGPAAAAVLAASLPGWLRATPGAQLAATLAPEVRGGARVVAAELWGPEVDYRLEREGLPGRVTLFPSDVGLHPGWYEESAVDAARLDAEARAVVHGTGARTFFVFSPVTKAGRALARELDAEGGARIADAGVFEVWLRSGGPRAPREGPGRP